MIKFIILSLLWITGFASMSYLCTDASLTEALFIGILTYVMPFGGMLCCFAVTFGGFE